MKLSNLEKLNRISTVMIMIINKMRIMNNNNNLCNWKKIQVLKFYCWNHQRIILAETNKLKRNKLKPQSYNNTFQIQILKTRNIKEIANLLLIAISYLMGVHNKTNLSKYCCIQKLHQMYLRKIRFHLWFLIMNYNQIMVIQIEI